LPILFKFWILLLFLTIGYFIIIFIIISKKFCSVHFCTHYFQFIWFFVYVFFILFIAFLIFRSLTLKYLLRLNFVFCGHTIRGLSIWRFQNYYWKSCLIIIFILFFIVLVFILLLFFAFCIKVRGYIFFKLTITRLSIKQ